jgi:hypothetical protein
MRTFVAAPELGNWDQSALSRKAFELVAYAKNLTQLFFG